MQTKLNRSIVIFPQLDKHADLIQNIRQQYDPVADKIAPHITLVFPFKSEISSDILYQHLQSCLRGFEPFDLCLKGISQEEGNYLFLNIVEGQEQIKRIHSLLYSGILQQFLSTKHHYQPHVTIAHLPDTLTMQIVWEKLESLFFYYEFRTQVSKITTEIILDDFSSKIDFEAVLAKDLPKGTRSGDTMKLNEQSKFSF